MAFQFRPAVYRGSELYELPRPIETLRVLDSWDAASLKVPLKAGSWRAGLSQNGVEIRGHGQLGTTAGNLVISEEDMFDAWVELRSRLSIGQPEEKFEFFLYCDVESAVYRKFKNCTTIQMEGDLSSKQLFEYDFVIFAEDPVIYSSGPGL